MASTWLLALSLRKDNLQKIRAMSEMKQIGIDLEIDEQTAQGHYSNVAIISHSATEFIVDFAAMLPGMPKAQVQTRAILTPEHAMRLMLALQDNLKKYEQTFGPIRLPEQGKGTYIPRLGDFKGEA